MAGDTCKLTKREEGTEGTLAFGFERPRAFPFRPGQCVDERVKKSGVRSDMVCRITVWHNPRGSVDSQECAPCEGSPLRTVLRHTQRTKR
jgi:hypothetical protein